MRCPASSTYRSSPRRFAVIAFAHGRRGLRHGAALAAMFLAVRISAAEQPVTIDVGASAPTVAPTPGNTGSSPFGRRIVNVQMRPALLPVTSLSLKDGQILAPENLSTTLNEIAQRLDRQSELAAKAVGGQALIVTYVDARFDLNPAGSTRTDTVAVTLRPFHVNVPDDDIGGRVLPIPRGLPTELISEVIPPRLLPVKLGLTNDRVLGTSIGGRWQFDVDPGGGTESALPSLRLQAGGMKSLTTGYYATDATVRGVRNRASGLLRQMSGGLEASVGLEPRGTERYRTRGGGGEAGISIAPMGNSRLWLDTRYTEVRHKFTGAGPSVDWRRTREQGNRLLFEMIPPSWYGFLRAAVWEENLQPRNGHMAQRLVGRIGYAREFPIADNQTIGLELIAGAGQTWGPVEAPRRFFAGGGQGDFLYEAALSRALTVSPDGPLLRSLGRAQGGLRPSLGLARGGTNFWHVNFNVTLPIPTWSRPLIPNETTDLPGPDGSPATLKQILRAQVDRTGPNFLQSTLQTTDHLSPDEARRRATQIFDEIRPATHFVIDQANVFAVKPLLMFDAAELDSPSNRASWLAAGLGVQLTIVTAKFELGYMHTVHGPTFGSRGNIFAKLGFERLF